MKSGKLNVILTSVALVFCIAILVTTIFAWIAVNEETTVSGMRFVADSDDVSIGDEIVIIRTIDNNPISYVYRKDSNGEYYEHDGTNWVLDADSNKKGISITGLLPGESIDFIVTMNREVTGIAMNYDINLKGLYAELFDYNYNDGEQDITDVHNMLEVIRLYNLSYDQASDSYLPVTDSDRFLLTYGSTDPDGLDYIALDGTHYAINTTEDTDPSEEVDNSYSYIVVNAAHIEQGVWAANQESMTCAFRIVFDTEQVAELHLTNALSLKRLHLTQFLITLN